MSRLTSDHMLRGVTARGRRLGAFAAFAIAGLLGTGCDVHGISDAGSLSAIVVSPNPTVLVVGASQQMTAKGTDFAGATVAISPTWAVVSGGGTISASGLFTAGSVPGTFPNTITATSNGKSATATVVVTAGPIVTITVTPNPQTLAIGAAQQFVAVARDASGNIVQFTPTWSVVAGGGSISSTGVFTAGTVSGTFANTVQASNNAIRGTATVTVTPGPLASIVVTPNPVTLTVGLSQQFTAVGRDAGGNAVAIAPVWTVAAGGGTISTSGLFVAGSTPGTFTNTVTATVGALSGTATVNVTAGPLATITVTPNPATVAIGAQQQFTAVGMDVGGNILAITPAWNVVAGGGSINSTGFFTAGNTAGTFTNTVSASVGNIAGFATVIVTTGPLASITVTPNPVFLPTNGTQQFIAVGRDAGGNVFVISPTWSVVNGGGTINPNTGLFTAGNNPGAFTNTVVATSGTVSGSATVNVTAVAPVLVSITVTPNPATVPANGTQQFNAVGRDAGGNVIPLSPIWSVVNNGGTINPVTGLFTAGGTSGTFTNTVQATSGNISGFATVNVTAPVAPLINLGTAAVNGVMAGTAFSCVTLGVINANIAIFPGNAVTGFPPCVITGVQNKGNAIAQLAQNDLTAAYNQLAGLPCTATITTNLGGLTLLPGVYCANTSIGITGNLFLDGNGDPNANFVFKAGSTLITAGNVVLINMAQAKNVYFQVGSSATLGTASQIQGNILALTSITLVDNANLIGRALARNGAVSLGTNNNITLP